MSVCRCLPAATVLVAAVSAVAEAQWDVIQLHPGGASRSWAIGVGDGQQAGFVTVDGVDHAWFWEGTAQSWVDLNPVGADRSQARRADGGQQVGTTTVNGVTRGSLWSGTAESWVDLTPYWAGATKSAAGGLGGGEQAGSATVDGVTRGGVWTGTADSWVDLHPFAATSSALNATDGVQQVGVATVGGSWRGSLWYGSADSWVDLTPSGAWGSYCTGVGGEQQVGYVWFGHPSGTTSRASLWSGTADSWVDLHPAGSNLSSFARAAHGGRQVGGVGFRACLWSGTAESMVDLHSFLPRKFSSSIALGIWQDDTCIYVVGYGYNSKRRRDEALMWIADYSPPSDPPGEMTVDGIFPDTMNAGDMIDVSITGSGFQPGGTVSLENGSGPMPTVDVIDVSPDGFTIEARISAPGGGPHGPRVWDVRVTNPDDSTGTLIDGLTVIR